MAHKRVDTLVKCPEWWKHLRENKRRVSKAERRAGKVLAAFEAEEPDETPRGLGLHKDPEQMQHLRKNAGELLVPEGIYCYDAKGNCPFWDKADNKPDQESGFCWLMGKGDWDEGVGELWDQCKCCGIREECVPEGTIPVVDEREAKDAGD